MALMHRKEVEEEVGEEDDRLSDLYNIIFEIFAIFMEDLLSF